MDLFLIGCVAGALAAFAYIVVMDWAFDRLEDRQ